MGTTGIEYLRVSDDDNGRSRSPGEQRADNLRATAAHGIESIDVDA